MCKKYGIKIALFLLLFLSTGFGQDIRVENVFVPQDSIYRNESGHIYLGFVNYDLLFDSEQETLAVFAEFSIDSQKTWIKRGLYCYGDFGRVVKGKDKSIQWSWYGEKPINIKRKVCFLKIIADTDITACGNKQPQMPIPLDWYKLDWYINTWCTDITDSLGRQICKYTLVVNWIESPDSCILGYNIYTDLFDYEQKANSELILKEDLTHSEVSGIKFVTGESDTIISPNKGFGLMYVHDGYCVAVSAVDSCGQESEKAYVYRCKDYWGITLIPSTPDKFLK